MTLLLGIGIGLGGTLLFQSIYTNGVNGTLVKLGLKKAADAPTDTTNK